MVKYALKVSYDGGRHHGFQRQLTMQTVQGELEKALSKYFKEPIQLVCAGRTDVGVHGLGQVVAFETAVERPAQGVTEAVNNILCDSILIRQTARLVAESQFHPRFSAKHRTYRYLVLEDCPPEIRLMWEERAWCLGGTLEVEKMQECAQLFLGTHDFATFTSQCDMPTTVREVKSIEVHRESWPLAGSGVTITITGNAFLRRMVRMLVASMVEVGLGYLDTANVERRFQALDPSRALHPAPPSGLYFHSVGYDPDPFDSEITEECYNGRRSPNVRHKP